MKKIYVLQKNTQYLTGHRVVVKNRTCRVCTKTFRYGVLSARYTPDDHLCVDCAFWYEKWRMRDDKTVLRVNGVHYIVGPEESNIRGFGGQKVTYKRKGGKKTVTTNLWHQGTIPAVWVGLGLTDNAEFVG